MSHTNYLSESLAEQQEMLRRIGAGSFDDLFSEIPKRLQNSSFQIPPGRSEMELMASMRSLASQNSTSLINFCGGGFYDHFIPSAVDSLSSRGEFFTAYTPYQAEASQGTLQAIYEYQTAIVRLTGMEVSNASIYDGGTALFEGMMMALHATGRPRVLVDEGVNPIYRAMLRCYTKNLSIDYREIPLQNGLSDRRYYRRELGSEVAAVVFQNPNFLGCIEDYSEVITEAHKAGALAVTSCYPISLGILKTPGEMGADIATGEGQSLGLPLSFGGPYLGFMATRKALVRRMPGRIVGAAQDAQGRPGYVLTLQAREQHIRRQKATSNICTNEALCALRASIYLSLVGKIGLVELAGQCASLAGYARERICSISKVRQAFAAPFFNEFAIRLPLDAAEVVGRLIESGIAAGFPVGRYYKGMDDVLLVAVTEKRTRKDIDLLAAHLAAALR